MDSRFTGGNFVFIIMRLISIVLAQAIILILAFKLDSENFGKFSLVFACSQILMIGASGWTSGLILNHGQREIANNRSAIKLVLFRFFCCTLISIFAALALQVFKENMTGFFGFADALSCLYLFVVAEVVYDQTQSLLEMAGESVSGAILAAVLKGIVFIYALSGDFSLLQYATFYAYCHAIYAVVVIIVFCFAEIKSQRLPSQQPIWDLLQYSVSALMTAIAVACVNNMSAIVIRGYGYSYEEIGSHSLAFRLASGFLVFSFFVRYYYPNLLYAKSPATVNSFVRLVTTKILYLYGVACLLGYWVVGAIMVFAFSDWLAGYDSFKYFFLMYSPVVFFLAACSFTSVIYQNSSHYVRDNLFYIAMSLVVALGVLMFGKISIYGVVLGYFLGYLLYFLLQRIFLNPSFFSAVSNWHMR